MIEKIKKFIEFDVKAADGEERAYWFTASTGDRDRHGDIIVPSGWKLQNFKKNPVILWAHNYSQPPIGKATEVKVENDKLRIKIQFVPEDIYPFASTIERMVKEKYLRTGSVGFMALKTEELSEEDRKQRPDSMWGRKYTQSELLEFSIVPVPAHPGALGDKEFGMAVAKSFGVDPDHEEKRLDILPYEKDGKVDERLLKASLAASLGARGGVGISNQDRKACFNHLARVARENGATVPAFKDYTPEELKETFKDVWHEELLDVVQNTMDDETKASLPFIKGPARAALIAARDQMSRLIDATEEDAIRGEEPIDPAAQESIKGLIKDLAATTAALK